jgi:hypothetical protein
MDSCKFLGSVEENSPLYCSAAMLYALLGDTSNMRDGDGKGNRYGRVSIPSVNNTTCRGSIYL